MASSSSGSPDPGLPELGGDEAKLSLADIAAQAVEMETTVTITPLTTTRVWGPI
jgi:hypothetical protein